MINLGSSRESQGMKVTGRSEGRNVPANHSNAKDEEFA